ncbi:hypothetical protein C8T65DRAFT_664101 [Cerioporus squamosus]|nr:hypothetical protein C8T65DRAFT_664101 [Cerioporus squamosus]
MSSSRLPDHELYARHIFPLGYGYPLWRPTGTRVGRRESDESHAEYCTRVGDVGVLARGGFTTMFNSMAAPEQEGGDSDSDLLPDGFQPLNARNLSMVGAHTVNDPFLCSAGITGVEVSAGSESDASAMAMHAKWTEQSGAVLALATPAYSRTIVSKRRIVEYMKQHHDSWVALAASADLNVNAGPKGVLFVSGTVTTTACGAFAYSRLAGGGDGQLGVSFDEREGVMRAELDGQEIRSAHGTGTGTGSAGASRGASGGEADAEAAMERRLWWSRAMQAAAGPHELPRGAEDDDEDDFPAYSAGDAECGEEEADERQYVYILEVLDFLLAGIE